MDEDHPIRPELLILFGHTWVEGSARRYSHLLKKEPPSYVGIPRNAVSVTEYFGEPKPVFALCDGNSFKGSTQSLDVILELTIDYIKANPWSNP